MLLLAWNTFRDRWPVFAGAVITVCLGVALVQSSLLALVAAATAPVPDGLSPEDALASASAYAGASTLLSLVLALSAFVAVFIVASTFGFTVAQRQRELALLRLTGADRRQVRSLLVGEALLLGIAGSGLGAAAGLPVMRLQVWTLQRFGFAPEEFDPPWRAWILGVSLGVGVVIAVLGVLAASHRAAKARPLEALRESGRAAKAMTRSRWAVGLVSTAGAAVLYALFPGGEAVLPAWFIQLTPFLVTVPLVVGFAALAPLLVPLTGWVIGLVARGPLGELAVSNLRSDARRSASTATPVMVLFAFVASIGGTLATVGEGAREETLRQFEADFVVTGSESDLSAVEGVRAVSGETPVLFELRFGEAGAEWFEAYDGLVADPADYAATHRAEPVAGDLADLTGDAVAVSANVAAERDWEVGDTLRLRIAGQERDARIAALLPVTLAGPFYLFPADAVPAGAQRQVVALADGADAEAAAMRLSAYGDVSTVEQWVDGAAASEERTTRNIMIVLLGTTMLYTVIAIVNAVVIAASSRRREFAAARVTGLGRGQVVLVALWESQAVALIGLVLGALAAAGSVLGASAAVRNATGLAVVAVQWPLLLGLALGAAVVVGATSVVTTLSATRMPPVRAVASRE